MDGEKMAPMIINQTYKLPSAAIIAVSIAAVIAVNIVVKGLVVHKAIRVAEKNGGSIDVSVSGPVIKFGDS